MIAEPEEVTAELPTGWLIASNLLADKRKMVEAMSAGQTRRLARPLSVDARAARAS